MSNEIPTRSREIVSARDGGRCLRCGGRTAAWHHRRSRRVHDDHTHCPCNGISLCVTCHSEVHSHPNFARVQGGWVVSAWDDPWRQRILTSQWGWVKLTCDGGYRLMAGKCANCDEPRDELENGWCAECLISELCCADPTVAARSGCGCGGSAAQALRRLRERMEAS